MKQQNKRDLRSQIENVLAKMEEEGIIEKRKTDKGRDVIELTGKGWTEARCGRAQ